jgi:LacI family transcriptional regulator
MVASTAGVSQPTVSKVLNGRDDVSSSTRARVEDAIRRLKYVPVAGRTRTEERIVEMVFDDLLSPYAAGILSGALDAGVEANVTVIAKRYSDEVGPSWAERLRSGRRDGVIVITSVITPEQVVTFDEAEVPLVAIDAINLPHVDITSIGATNFTGGFTATQHLIALGHRRIAYLSGPVEMACNVARLHGYRAALEKASIPLDDALTAYGPFTYEAGLLRAGTWLDQPDRATAIFAGCDLVAFGVIEAARKKGLRVPDDLSVVGFDDSYAAQWSSPPLTTIHQPLREMGALAMRTLLRLSAGEALDSHHVELATQLVVRESTARPRLSKDGP